MSFRPSDSLSEVEAVAALDNCIRDVHAWMREDMLWLNDDKTKFLLIGSRQQLAKAESMNGTKGRTCVVRKEPGGLVRLLPRHIYSHIQDLRLNILLSLQHSSHQEIPLKGAY